MSKSMPIWKTMAIEDIKKLNYLQTSIKSLKQKIKLEEEKMNAYSGGLSATPVQGGSSSKEDKLINAIAKKSELEKQKQIAEMELETINFAFTNLPKHQQDMLYTYYLSRNRGNMTYFCQKYSVSKAKAYLDLDAALQNFTRISYGVN